jgi:phosphoribosylpyrophosphate synthetase
MLRSEIEFASFMAYSVRGSEPDADNSRLWMSCLKSDRQLKDPPQLTSQRIADGVKKRLGALPFTHYFGPHVVFVPVPSSSKLQPNSLWVPHRLSKALVVAGLGSSVEVLVEREHALSKSATSAPSDRPTAQRHFDSMKATDTGFVDAQFVLVDDVITRGATMLAAASRLADAFPNATIGCLAVMRAISGAAEFKGVVEPVIGKITLNTNGGTFRRP